MNHYGAQVKAHWQAEKAAELGELQDPEAYFEQVGQEVAQAVEERARTLAGAAPAGEGYLARLQRLNTARVTAEAEVVREYLLTEEASLPES